MPKIKTKSSIKKRFKITATGKIRYSKAFGQHNMRKRNRSRLRSLKGMNILSHVERKRIISSL